MLPAVSCRGSAGPASLSKHQANVSASSSQRSIREFLKVRTSYDVLPLSFRLIVLDTSLLIKKSLNILIQNSEYTRTPGSAPAHRAAELCFRKH